MGLRPRPARPSAHRRKEGIAAECVVLLVTTHHPPHPNPPLPRHRDENMIRVYNTATKPKETFSRCGRPSGHFSSCGPTVYKPSHIVHMVGPVIFDAIKRTPNLFGL